MNNQFGHALALCLSILPALGCDVGRQRVNEPRLLVAPKGRAVIIFVEDRRDLGTAPVLDERGGCLGYTQSGSWFAARLPAGEQVLHTKTSDNLLSVKVDLEAGKTYFLHAAWKAGVLDLTPIRPSDREWKTLDRLLADSEQYVFDRKQCDATLSEMTWMPGQDLPKLLAAGKRRADAAGLLLKADDGVSWRGSAAKSAR